jgi:FHS family L-fucose permease-like MFS transporter
LPLQNASSFRASLALLSGSFFLWGILRSLDDLLVALFHASAMLHYATAMLIHFSFFSAYLLVSVPAGIYLRRHGYRKALTRSLLLMALGSAICVPAVHLYSFALCLAGIFVMALGIAALQTVANPCIGLLGSEKTATARLLLVQGFSSFGSVIGPLAGIALFGDWSLRDGLVPLVFPGRMLAAIYIALTACLGVFVLLMRRYFASTPLAMHHTTGGMDWRMLRHRRPGPTHIKFPAV